MTQKPGRILDNAIEVLRRGQNLTLDAVARESGLTKPGIVHHFATKEALTVAVLDRVIDQWEAHLLERLGGDTDPSPRQRLRAYVDYAFTGSFTLSDLALLADVRLRESLCNLWIGRLGPWLGTDISGNAEERADFQAARLLADGAWFDQALGVVDMSDAQRERIKTRALDLIGP